MKITIFKKVGNIAQELLTQRTKEELFFSEKFKNFFVLEDYLFCHKMIDEGYNPTNSEKDKLNNITIKKLENNEYFYKDIRFIKLLTNEVRLTGLLKVIPTIEHQEEFMYRGNSTVSMLSKLFDKKGKVEQEEFILNEINGNKKMIVDSTINYFKEYKKFYSAGLDSHGDFCKHSHGERQLRKETMIKHMYANVVLMRAGLLIPEEIESVKNVVESLSNYMKKKTAHRYSDESYSKSGKPFIDDFIKLLNNQLHKEIIVNKDELLRQLKSYSTRTKSLSEEIKDLINQEDYSIDKLPLLAKNKIENIQKVIKEINNEDATLFFQNRLPIILKKYFSIDEEYRTTLKNVEGFNSQELMFQSLENIERILIAKKEDNNYDLVSELSVENRKLKMQKVM